MASPQEQGSGGDSTFAVPAKLPTGISKSTRRAPANGGSLGGEPDDAIRITKYQFGPFC